MYWWWSCFPDHEHCYCNKDTINNENTWLPKQWCWIDPTYELLRDVIVVMLSVFSYNLFMITKFHRPCKYHNSTCWMVNLVTERHSVTGYVNKGDLRVYLKGWNICLGIDSSRLGFAPLTIKRSIYGNFWGVSKWETYEKSGILFVEENCEEPSWDDHPQWAP